MSIDVQAYRIDAEAFAEVELPASSSGLKSGFDGEAMDILCKRLGFTLYVDHMDTSTVAMHAKWLGVHLKRLKPCKHRARKTDCVVCDYKHLKKWFDIVASRNGEVVCVW
jgi:hypothetical protein